MKIFISNLQCINFTAFTKPKARRLGVVVNWWKVFDVVTLAETQIQVFEFQLGQETDVAAIFLDRDMKFKHHLEFRWRWKFNMFKYQTKDNQPKLLKQVKWKIKDYSKWLTYCSCTGKCMQRKKHNMTIYIYIIYVKIFKFLYIDNKHGF